MGRWKYLPFLLESFDVKFNGFLNQLQYFLAGFSGDNAAGKVWNICPKTRRPFFNHN